MNAPITDPFIQAIVSLVGQQLEARLPDFPALQPLLATWPDTATALVEHPPDPTLGDYALPCYLLAKALRQGPPQIAQTLAQALQPALAGHPLLTTVEPSGPYLNFRVNFAAMATQDIPAMLSGAYFTQTPAVGQPTVMVEYSQPNTHKAFHVGHMRNVALGDALVRILEYTGQRVLAVNYIGDVGTHIAKCLWYYQNHRPQDPPAHNRGEWLGELYTAATRLLEDAQGETRLQYEREVSQTLQQLEAQEGPVFALWKETRQWSLDAFQEIYRWLGARFDHDFYESDMTSARRIVEEGLEKGVFARSQGAVGVDLEAYGLGFFLVLKGDGTTLYSTKDLALAEEKFQRFGITTSIYVVGAEQTLHFRQVFKTLDLLGYPQAQASSHLAYGLVMLPEGKMSSRAGNVILFSELRHRLNDFIVSHYLSAHQGDWPQEEIDETCRRVAVAAIRYGMVKQDPAKTITFSLEDWLVAEGDTGVYLCYAYTRVQSILRVVGQIPDPQADFSLLTHETERGLLRELHDFNRVVAQAARLQRPNLLAGALFQLAKAFSRCYAVCSVKNAETPALGQARLAMFAATGRVLGQGLALLGITPPERM